MIFLSNLYIATDNRTTQQLFFNKYKDRIKVIKLITNNNKARQTSLKTAIIDLYMCAHSSKF